MIKKATSKSILSRGGAAKPSTALERAKILLNKKATTVPIPTPILTTAEETPPVQVAAVQVAAVQVAAVQVAAVQVAAVQVAATPPSPPAHKNYDVPSFELSPLSPDDDLPAPSSPLPLEHTVPTQSERPQNTLKSHFDKESESKSESNSASINSTNSNSNSNSNSLTYTESPGSSVASFSTTNTKNSENYKSMAFEAGVRLEAAQSQISALEKELLEMKEFASFEDEDKNDNANSKKVAELEAALGDAEAQHKKELDALKLEIETKTQKTQLQTSDAEAQHKEELDALNFQLETQKTLLQTSDAEAQHKEELDALKLNFQLETQKTQLQTSDAAAQHKEELDALKLNFQLETQKTLLQTSDAEAQHKEKLDSLQKEVAVLKNTIAENSTTDEIIKEELLAENDELQAQMTYLKTTNSSNEEVSERSERALRKTRILKRWISRNFPQTATSTTELTLFHSIRLARLVRSCFVKNAHNLASLGAARGVSRGEYS